jgi:hypothetical protein
LICEHWIHKSEIDSLKLPAYSILNSFARNKYDRGGVIILGKRNLKFKKLKFKSTELFFEITGIVITFPNNEKIIFVVIYRPSNLKSNSKIDEFFKKLESALMTLRQNHPGIKAFIVGDNNINLLIDHGQGKNLKDIFAAYDFSLLNSEPTRYAEKSSSLIDHIFSDYDNNLIDIKTEPVFFSDHEAVILTMPFATERQETKFYRIQRIFSNTNINKFKLLLEKANWDPVLYTEGAEEKYSMFLEIFLSEFKQSFPTSRICMNSKKPHLFPPSLKEEGERLKMFSRYVKQNPNEADRNYLANWKKYYSWKIFNFQSRKDENFIKRSTNKIKAAWSVVNTKLEKSKSQDKIQSLCVNDAIVTDPIEIATVLNKHFIVPKPESADMPDLTHIERNNNLFFLSPTTPPEIYSTIMSLSSTKAAGEDEVPCYLLKTVAEFIAIPLCDVINASFEQGVYPSKLKIAKIIPLFKNKGNKEDPNQYRPIAILPSFSKVFGKIFSKRLISFFDQNNLFYEHQHGFRKKKGTSTALFDLVTRIFEAVDSGEQCSGMFYDFSKAFDSLNHQILIEKLSRYGVKGIPLDWIKSFLSDRQQMVQVETIRNRNNIDVKYSPLLLNESGIGQGSILGPNVFNIFINDLAFLILIAFLLFYADDSNCLVKARTVKELYEKAKTTNSTMDIWSSTHFLQLNSTKTNILQFHKPRTAVTSSPYLVLNGNTLKTAEVTKFLGMHLDDSLNYKAHCSSLIKKLGKCPFMFVMLRTTILDINVLKSVYFAHAQSHLQYGIICWGNSVLSDDVFRMQRKIVRALFGFRYKRWYKELVDCKELFVNHQILSLPSLYVYECCKFARKNMNLFSTKTELCPYNYRRKNDLLTTNFCDSPKNNVIRVYNKLPKTIKEIKSYDQFALKLKELLIKKCYYTVKEYFSEKWQS